MLLIVLSQRLELSQYKLRTAFPNKWRTKNLSDGPGFLTFQILAFICSMERLF